MFLLCGRIWTTWIIKSSETSMYVKDVANAFQSKQFCQTCLYYIRVSHYNCYECLRLISYIPIIHFLLSTDFCNGKEALFLMDIIYKSIHLAQEPLERTSTSLRFMILWHICHYKSRNKSLGTSQIWSKIRTPNQ